MGVKLYEMYSLLMAHYATLHSSTNRIRDVFSSAIYLTLWACPKALRDVPSLLSIDVSIYLTRYDTKWCHIIPAWQVSLYFDIIISKYICIYYVYTYSIYTTYIYLEIPAMQVYIDSTSYLYPDAFASGVR